MKVPMSVFKPREFLPQKHVARQPDIEDIKADYIIGMDEPTYGPSII